MDISPFIIVDMDGYNLGIEGDFCATYLEFDTLFDAIEVLEHWRKWIYE